MADNTPNYVCIHEEQIQGQSRAIERLDAELGYKKERLDELKADNKRMENKIDDIKDCVNEIVLASKNGDERLNNRLTVIETRLDEAEKARKEDRADTNLKLAIGMFIIGALTLYFNYIHHL